MDSVEVKEFTEMPLTKYNVFAQRYDVNIYDYDEKYFKETPTFGKGSSSVGTLFTRFVTVRYCEKEHYEVINHILKDEKTLHELRETFLFNLQKDKSEYLLQLCNRGQNNKVNFIRQSGGFYLKYLKYKKNIWH